MSSLSTTSTFTGEDANNFGVLVPVTTTRSRSPSAKAEKANGKLAATKSEGKK
jgi:hypothetical protein